MLCSDTARHNLFINAPKRLKCRYCFAYYAIQVEWSEVSGRVAQWKGEGPRMGNKNKKGNKKTT